MSDEHARSACSNLPLLVGGQKYFKRGFYGGPQQFAIVERCPNQSLCLSNGVVREERPEARAYRG
jgi:hypothetical protein